MKRKNNEQVPELLKGFYELWKNRNNEYYNYLLNVVDNINFKNNQNYVLPKKIVNNIKNGMNITENGQNMIGFDKDKKIQEIEISRVTNKTIGLKFFLFGMFFFFYITILLDDYQNGFDQGTIASILILTVFAIFFIPFWFISFGAEDYLFYKNKDKIIVLKK